jgi:dienelactone hydrolase
VEWSHADPPDWIQEKVSFDAAYDNERVTAYLFLPKRFSPPFQTVIYVSGLPAITQGSSGKIDQCWEFERYVSFMITNGRAVLFPVYKGTFERGNMTYLGLVLDPSSHQYQDYFIKIVKDFRRSIDYLETRSDVDRTKLAYLGFSLGGEYGPVISAVDDRVKVNVFIVGGFRGAKRPEVNPANYARRVKTPTLMLNGRYDVFYPYETGAKPMFDRLGTAAGEKDLKLYETDHFVPRNELIKESLAWLDRFLGPVK